MATLAADDPLAVRLGQAVAGGSVEALLAEHPEVATLRVADGRGCERDALHLLLDWPGGRPGVPQAIRALVAAGADPDSPLVGPSPEAPLHWAASIEGGVPAIDALLDAGADIEAQGSCIDGGSALSNALAFGLEDEARRLVERGAAVGLWQAAALGSLDRVRLLSGGATPGQLRNALWCAAHGGQQGTARYLVEIGADPTWVGHDHLTAAGAARRRGADDLADWLDATAAAASAGR